jgi:predicted ThiF/HesA family dinucleotide-utilizing enzyme
LYGKSDKVRPWELTKVTYEGKIGEEKFKFIAGMGHEVSSKTVKEIRVYFDEIFMK